MAQLQLRVKHKGGQSVISSLKKDNKLADLLAQLSVFTGIPVKQIKVLKGFPPVAINIEDTDVLLSDCDIQERDTLLVEELPVLGTNVTNMKATTVDVPTKGSPAEQCNRRGILLRKVVPADNSCLFTSIGFCLSGTLFCS